jgi:hypothetical protein
VHGDPLGQRSANTNADAGIAAGGDARLAASPPPHRAVIVGRGVRSTCGIPASVTVSRNL